MPKGLQQPNKLSVTAPTDKEILKVLPLPEHLQDPEKEQSSLLWYNNRSREFLQKPDRFHGLERGFPRNHFLQTNPYAVLLKLEGRGEGMFNPASKELPGAGDAGRQAAHQAAAGQLQSIRPKLHLHR